MSGILIHNFNVDVNSPLSHRGIDCNSYIKVNGWKMHHYSAYDGSYLLYDGEIDNYKELRSKYFSTTQFTTTSDTELIYHILISERYDLLDKIDGIFAFVFYKNNQIIYGRDPFGLKPLFQFDNKTNFALSSELQIFFKLINLQINDELLPEFIKYCYIGSDNTIYKNVSRVRPGRIYIKDHTGVREKIFTTVFDNIDNELQIDNNEILLDIKSAVESQTIADTGVGLALSGGIDSTLVAKFIPKNTKSFSSFFFEDFAFDESTYIDTVANKYGLQNKKILYDEQYFEKNLVSVFYRRGGILYPLTIAMEQIAQQASSDVKVLLTGAGADGLFLGHSRLQEIDNDSDIVNHEQYFTNKDARKFFNWSNEKEHMAKNSRMKFLYNFNKSVRAKVQMLGFHYGSNHYHEMLDYTYMKYSVVGRIPFLRQSFAKKMLGIPYKKLVGDLGWHKRFRGKLPLKNLVAKDFGKEFAFRDKIGFTTPWFIWMYSDFCYNLIISIIKTSDIVNTHIKKIHLDDICQKTGVYNTREYRKLFWSILNLGSLQV